MIERKDFRVLIVYPNLSMMLTPSYAVGLFTAVLKQEGYAVDLFDCTPYQPSHEHFDEPLPVTRANKMLNSRKFDPIALYGHPKSNLTGDFSEKLDSFHPHAVIISTLVEDTWPQACELLNVLSEYKTIRSIIGGVFATMAPEIIIKNPHVECLGIGDGEETVIDFCECIRNGGTPVNIPNTWAKDGDGTIIKNSFNHLVDINRIVPDFSLFDERRFLRPLGARIWKAVPLETSRGCPYMCTYCNSPVQRKLSTDNKRGNYLRRKTPESLRREIEALIESVEPEFFYLNDDCFLARPNSEFDSFVKMYRDYKIPFWLQTRFEGIDAEKLADLVDVGCYRISFGLEHGNEDFRMNVLKRKITNAEILEKSRLVADSGIPYTLNNIVGFPYETKEMVFDTITLSKEVASFDSLSVNIFVPYHGTMLRDMAIAEGWLDPDRQTTSVIAESILEMPSPYLSGSDILSLQRVMPLYVKFPESRYPEIERAEKFNDEGNAVFETLSDEFYQMTYGVDEADRKLTYSG